MDSLQFDDMRFSKMDAFLKRLAKISYQNNLLLTDSIVYHELCAYELKDNDYETQGKLRDVSDMFEMWQRDFHSSNSRVFVSPSFYGFCQFVNGERIKDRRFIKLYIPLDHEHLYEGSKQLFEFLEKEGIVHESKIARQLRSDNVVIRLKKDDYESTKKIIEFVNSNEYIKEGLNEVNPFIATIQGVGFMVEHGYSYNFEMSKLMASYINDRWDTKNVSIGDFCNWFNENIDYFKFHDEDFSDLEIAKQLKQHFVHNELKPKDIVFEERKDSELTRSQKFVLLSTAVAATCEKYGANQAEVAILEVIKNNNYGYFTNADSQGLRNLLVKNITPAEMQQFLVDTLDYSNEDYYVYLEDAVANYVNIIAGDTLPLELDEICSVTLGNYSDFQLQAALKNYLDTGDPNMFSRYPKDGDNSINYRDKLCTYGKNQLERAMRSSLALKGIDVRGMNNDSIIPLYVNEISKLVEDKKTSQK